MSYKIGDILIQKLPLLTILLTVTAVDAGVFIYTQQWLYLGIAVVVWVFVLLSILRTYNLNAKRVAHLFDSVENGDQSFIFSEKWKSSEDKLVSDSLNRINRVLFNIKAEVIQKEKYYELILNTVNTGILVIDDLGHVFQINMEALRLLGLTVFTHVRQLSKVDSGLEQLIQSVHPGEKHQISYSNERGTVNLLVRVSGMTLKEKLVRIIAINDINPELDQKELDSWMRLSRVLTHEIMNSITPITSLSETLLKSCDDEGNGIKDGLQVIQSTGKHLISFVESYRKYTHIPTPTPALFYVSEFVLRMKQLAYHQHPYDNITVKVDIQPDDLLLYADESLISQVLLNLLKNAFEAIGDKKEGGFVHIRAYVGKNEEITIEVRNNGPVISSEVQEHIFVPFFTTKEKGSGVGLSVSRQIMRLSGGNLMLKTAPDTEETVFSLIFP